MSIEIDDMGYVKVHFRDHVLAGLTYEQKRDLGERLVYDSEMFSEIVADLAHGLASPTFNSYLHKARLELRGRMPEVARELITTLIHELEQAKLNVDRHESWAWKLYHAWPEHSRGEQPECPPFLQPSWTECRAKADALLQPPAVAP
jgi:hypothetical protein